MNRQRDLEENFELVERDIIDELVPITREPLRIE